MAGSKSRIKWVELAQIISMLLVCFHHSIPNFTEANATVIAFASTVHYPALAVFFICSGFFSTGWSKESYGAYIKKRALRLLLPWVIISILMLIPKAVLASDAVRSNMLSFRGVVFSFIDPHGSGILPHLWFLPTLFLFSLLMPIIKAMSKNKGMESLVFLISLIFAALDIRTTTVFCINELRMYFFWYLLGYIVKDNGFVADIGSTIRWITPAILFTVATLATILFGREQRWFRIVITMLGAVAVFSIAILLQTQLTGFISFFRGKIFIVYLLSLCVQNLLEVVANKVGLNGDVSLVIMFIVGVCVPLIVYEIVRVIERVRGKKLPKAIHLALGMT